MHGIPLEEIDLRDELRIPNFIPLDQRDRVPKKAIVSNINREIPNGVPFSNF